ncbi:MAG: hypothetical protein KDE27_06465 [Planctomycetes bacterium]|nr:hypothetical protein [Planctomycetota bacterium]
MVSAPPIGFSFHLWPIALSAVTLALGLTALLLAVNRPTGAAAAAAAAAARDRTIFVLLVLSCACAAVGALGFYRPFFGR